MVSKNINLNFHQTFKPERKCLTALLTALPECSSKSLIEISKITGIPTGERSGKVVPTIQYLEYMGLITSKLVDKKYQLDYTDLGKKILLEDPGFVEELTLLILHCMITRENSGASLWGTIVCKILPKYHMEINKANFNKELELFYEKAVNVSPFHGTYTGVFEQLGLLNIKNDGYCMNPHDYNPEFIYLYALALYEYWEDWYKSHSESEREEKHISDTEITSLQLEEIAFRYPFGWSEQKEYQILEHLHDRRIIVLNRQMSPFTIRKICSKEEIIELLYTELC